MGNKFGLGTALLALGGLFGCAADLGSDEVVDDGVNVSVQASTQAADWTCWNMDWYTGAPFRTNNGGGGGLHSACATYNTQNPRDPWGGLVTQVTCVNQAEGAPDTHYSCPWWGYFGPEPLLVSGGPSSCPPGQVSLGNNGHPVRLPNGTMTNGNICIAENLELQLCQPSTCQTTTLHRCGQQPNGCGGTNHCFQDCNFQMGCGFDWQHYLNVNPDLGAAGINTAEGARWHYDNHGRNEGRSCNATGCKPCTEGGSQTPQLPQLPGQNPPSNSCKFDWEYYLRSDVNSDLRPAGLTQWWDAEWHYDAHGRNENRNCSPTGCKPCTLPTH